MHFYAILKIDETNTRKNIFLSYNLIRYKKASW